MEFKPVRVYSPALLRQVRAIVNKTVKFIVTGSVVHGSGVQGFV